MRLKGNKYSKYKAFTLAELIIISGIISVMAGVAIASLSSTRNRTSLNAATSEVAAAIKLAQSYALQGKQQNGQAVCGYGFHFIDPSLTQYEIFYNRTINGTCENQVKYYQASGPNSSATVETHNLNSAVTLQGTVTGSSVIYFLIPNGDAYDNNGSAYPASGNTFTFQAGSASNQKTITINSRGQVVEN